MNEDATTIEMEEEDAPILPDGWHEGMDIFAENAPLLDDGQPDETERAEDDDYSTLLGKESTVDDPATDADEADSETSAEDPESEVSADGQISEERASRILKYAYNHNDEEFDFGKATDEELIEMRQKQKAFDAWKEDQRKQRFREVYERQIDSGMTEELSLLAAQSACDGKTYSLTDDDEVVDSTEEEPAEQQTATRDFRSELTQLHSLFPGVREMPAPVMDAYMNGADLVTAYSAYNAQQTAQAAAEIKKENAILKHNAASAAKAPVRGVTSGGSPKDKPEDPFLRGLKDEYW